MIRFSDEERNAMIKKLIDEDEEILNLEKEHDKLKERVDVLDSKIGKIEERKEAIMTAFGVTYNYLKRQYELDDIY